MALNALFLLGLVLFPAVSYAHHTPIDEVVIHHNEPLPQHFISSVESSLQQVRQVEIYRATPGIDICVNDGSLYPKLIRGLMGDDVFRAFANKSVMMGTISGPDQMQVWGRQVSTSQFLAHAMIHNLQYAYHGFWDANPLGQYPEWKWEGYVEYELLGKNKPLSYFEQKLETTSGDAFAWVVLEGGLSTIKQHIAYLMLVKYCMEEKDMAYDELMAYEVSEIALREELEAFLKK